MIGYEEAVEKLKKGNALYVESKEPHGDVSPEIRLRTAMNGQEPYAIVVCCSDSRVIPESIFSCGIGDIFTVRVAGNVIDDHQLGSIEYAAAHLGCKLVLVLGHTKCGAVGAAIKGEDDGFIRTLTAEIKLAIGSETDDYKASCLNAKRSAEIIRKEMSHIDGGIDVEAAMYDIETGKVEWLDR